MNSQITFPIANGDTLIPEFTKVLHHGNFGLQEGDVFTIPTVFHVLSRQTKSGPSEYINVINQHNEIREFYPTQLTKTARIRDSNVVARGVGSVNDYARQFIYVKDLMESLKGKTIRVTFADRYTTSDGPRTIYSFDFV